MDIACLGSVSSSQLRPVALCAASITLLLRSKSPWGGTHTKEIELPPVLSQRATS